MTLSGTIRRFKRLLSGTCLSAGLLLGVFVSAAEAQTLPADYAGTTTTPDTTGTSTSTTDPVVMTTGSVPKKAALADGGAVNARATKLSGLDTLEDPTEDTSFGRQNSRESSLDGLRPAIRPVGETPGIRLGSFILRPSLTQSVGMEKTSSAGTSSSRSYLETDLKGTLTSDWSLHQLTISGEGVYQRNLSGEGQVKPSANINADLRLDLSDQTVAHITGGYALTRESATDPNAVLNAIDQSNVSTFSGGASVERDFGLIRGLAAVDLSRSDYSDVTLSDGSALSLEDRNRNTYGGRLRVGYEISPALIPFLEASASRTVYDLSADSAGYERDMTSYTGKAGVEVDLGDKLKGELGAGYRTVSFADARLASINALVLDASAVWSPRRGTDVTLGMKTTVEPSVSAGQSGYVNRTLSAEIAQQMRDNMVAKLAATQSWRFYEPAGTRESVSTATASLSYGLTRYLDLTGNIGWERTAPENGSSTDVLRAGVGLTLKR